jgi:hypothetical protein
MDIALQGNEVLQMSIADSLGDRIEILKVNCGK